jgi:hypothetical protein
MTHSSPLISIEQKLMLFCVHDMYSAADGDDYDDDDDTLVTPAPPARGMLLTRTGTAASAPSVTREKDSPGLTRSQSPADSRDLLHQDSRHRNLSFSSNGSAKSLSALAHKQSFRKASSKLKTFSVDSDSSEVSSAKGFESFLEEDAMVTATRLEHLERILSKVNAVLQKEEDAWREMEEDLAYGHMALQSFSEDSQGEGISGGLSDTNWTRSYVEQRGSKNLRGENIFTRADNPLRRLPGTTTDMQKWTHLAYQLNLPALVVLSMARSIVQQKFFMG